MLLFGEKVTQKKAGDKGLPSHRRRRSVLYVRSDDEVASAVVAEQRAAHAVVHVANRADTDGDEVEDERSVVRDPEIVDACRNRHITRCSC